VNRTDLLRLGARLHLEIGRSRRCDASWLFFALLRGRRLVLAANVRLYPPYG
jgi:hypothetical protein